MEREEADGLTEGDSVKGEKETRGLPLFPSHRCSPNGPDCIGPKRMNGDWLSCERRLEELRTG